MRGSEATPAPLYAKFPSLGPNAGDRHPATPVIGTRRMMSAPLILRTLGVQHRKYVLRRMADSGLHSHLTK